MGRLYVIVALLVSFTALPSARPQSQIDAQIKEAGVCARCHVVSVMEWGMSAHRQAGTTCIKCHGESLGHVKDERDNVKPDRIPRKAAIAGLCATCHTAGCPNTLKTADCQSCHHVHALIDPNKEPTASDERLHQLTLKWQDADRHLAEGDRQLKAQQWEKAATEFRAALDDRPGFEPAQAHLLICQRRLKPGMPGFEVTGKNWDDASGLPINVRVADLRISMVLVPGGATDIGSDQFPNAKPVHTVRVDAFYLGKYEVTRAEWHALMGTDPSAQLAKDVDNTDRLPVDQLSWEDAQAFVRKLNERVPGGGFRLPTEAEWEVAARAGNPLSGAELTRVAWFDAPEKTFQPMPVGSKQPSGIGLFDMQGNVWEWCSSLYRPYPYDPADGRESPTGQGLRVLRGGGYADTAEYLDPAFRHGERPDQRLAWNGMRIARSVPAN